MNRFSKLAIAFIIAILVSVRLFYVQWSPHPETNVLTWDAFGYYLLLPAQFIYKDVKRMDWVEPVITKYNGTLGLLIP